MSQNNFSNRIDESVCPNCRQRHITRIDGSYIVGEVRNLLFLEKGILYTIRELMFRPGESVRTFINVDRNRLVKPVIYLILTSLVYVLINQYFPFEETYISFEGSQTSYTTKILKWVVANYGYSNLIFGVFIAFWARILFRKFGYNFFEILILMCFVMGTMMLIVGVFGLAENLSGLPMMQVGGVISFIYASWAIGQFFKPKLKNYVKAAATYIIGFISFALATLIVGLLTDFLAR